MGLRSKRRFRYRKRVDGVKHESNPFSSNKECFQFRNEFKNRVAANLFFNRSKIAIFQIKMTYRLIENVASLRSLVECNALSLNPKVYKKVI